MLIVYMTLVGTIIPSKLGINKIENGGVDLEKGEH